MIKNQFLNDHQLIGIDKALLLSMSGFGSPKISQGSYDRGSHSGSIVSDGVYRGFDLSLTYLITGNGVADFIRKRDWFIGLWRLDSLNTNPVILKTVLSDGSVRSIQVKQVSLVSDPQAASPTSCEIAVTIKTEREYFVGEDKDILVNGTIASQLGMQVPMEIPTSLNRGIAGSESYGVAIVNNGNFDSAIKATIYGPCDSFSLILRTGRQDFALISSINLDKNQYVYLDFYNEIASQNNITNVLSTISGTWWRLPPGESKIQFIAASGRAGIIYHDAFLNI
jgi:hypothetical protein